MENDKGKKRKEGEGERLLDIEEEKNNKGI
jgi:hypothetical protein